MPQGAKSQPGSLPPQRRREARLAFAVTVIVTSVIALFPGPAGAPSLIGWDKLDHVAAFAALALLARMGWPGLTRRRLAYALMVYGLLIEAGQAQPAVGRTASLTDVAADAIGIALGLALAWTGGQIARRTGR